METYFLRTHHPPDYGCQVSDLPRGIFRLGMVGLCQHALAFGMRGKVPTTGFVLGALAKATSLLHCGLQSVFFLVPLVVGATPVLPDGTFVPLVATGELFNFSSLHKNTAEWQAKNSMELKTGRKPTQKICFGVGGRAD